MVEPRRTSAPSPARRSSPGAARRVLLIDDDADVRLITDIALARIGGFSVTGVGSAREARAALQRERPDVVLLDVELPDADGPSLAMEISRTPGLESLPIVILSGYPMAEEAIQLKAYGVVGAIQKPFDPMTLARTVREMVGVGLGRSTPPGARRGAQARARAGFGAACSDGGHASSDAPDAKRLPRRQRRPDADVATGPLSDATELPGPSVRMDFARPDFFAAPVPSDDLLSGATPAIERWPGADAGTFVGGLAELARASGSSAAVGGQGPGASLAGAIYFTLTAPIDAARLPTAATQDGPIVVIDIDPSSSEVGRRMPLTFHFETDGGPFGAPNLLSALPVQGIPLRPHTRYAAVVRRAQLGLGRGPELTHLLATGALSDASLPGAGAYADGLRAVVAQGIAADDIGGLAVFSTSDPAAGMASIVSTAKALPHPDLGGFELIETYDRFCVYTKTVAMPDFQSGEPPFSNAGEGVWAATVQRQAPSRLFLTIPRAPAPAAGYPTVVFIRTGGGGDRPLIDRGLSAAVHADPIVPHGTGPAMNLAAAGWAGISWDGPHGGPRNPGNADEQFLVFNVLNAGATRDNVRQTALEAILLRSWLGELSLDGAGCDGASATIHLDDQTTAIMGHSMGGWIAPIALAYEPAFRAAIVSGAGGSWIENVVYKRSPVDVRPLAETILGYPDIGRTLQPHDPALTLLQWAGEVADPQVYGARVMSTVRNVLMIEGIVDTYIMPPIANATSLTLGLDLAGPAHDADDPRLDEFVPLEDLLGFVGRADIPFPARANRDGKTAVVVQAPGDELEDGHEAMFQTPGPKYQYRCFMADLAAGHTPAVRAPAGEWDACEAVP
ncbi:MAG: response regulator [Myxococcota bacterium]